MPESFETYLNSLDIDELVNQINLATPQDVEYTLSKPTLDLRDFLNLISDSADTYLEEIATRAHQTTVQNFGKNILLYTPIYISDYCDNLCVYCGFNCKNKFKRTKLKLEQIEDEFRAVYEQGFRDILILTGESKRMANTDYIAEAVKIAKKIFKSVNIEVYPMDRDEYQLIKKSGANGLTLYQETYNKKIYKSLHLFGSKSNFEYRLEGPERAGDTGFDQINLGALLGLHNPDADAIAMWHHLKYLEKKYPFVEIGASFPRIQQVEGTLPYKAVAVSDKKFVKYITAFRLCYPRLGIAISTRESSFMRKNLLPLGVTKMSAGVSTVVGGHTLKTSNNPQFNISDSSSIDDIINMIQDSGYQVLYSDWVN